MGRKKPTTRDDESGHAGVVAGGKLKKKALVNAGDEYFVGTESSKDAAVPDENLAPVCNKKKGKKGGSKKTGQKDEDDHAMDNEAMEEEEDNAPAIKFTGKKKSKEKKSRNNSMFSSSTFGLSREDEEGDDIETKDNDDEESGEPVITFSGKRKPSKSKKGGGGFSSAFDLLEEEESKENEESSKEEEEDVGITFTGKKKSLKSSNKACAVVFDEENDEDVSNSKTSDDNEDDVIEFKFLIKKKFSKKKTVASEVGNGDASSNFIEPTQHIHESTTRKQTNEDVAETSTKNKKKGGKAGQEEDELDTILTELGVIPSEPKDVPTSAEQNQPEVEGEKEEPVESVAAEKKKRMKEKEKEKRAAAAGEKLKETESEASNKLAGKKLPKHVRKMQEKLARLKELEEKRKWGGEEKLQKEEAERIWKEEGRISDEKKRLKKAKEKEKQQKEIAHWLEAMRRQILANATFQIPTGETSGAPAKRPLYQKKNLKPLTQSNGADASDSAKGTESKDTQQEIVLELDSPEGESIEDVASWSAKDKNDATDVVLENVFKEEEEWDAKSWDEADLKLPGKSAFADEEVDPEPEPLGTYLHHKEIKAAMGIKITAQGLEHTIAGTSLYVVGPHDHLEEIKKAAAIDMKSVMSRIDRSGEGVYVQASTLGSLEALLEFLKTPAVNLPVSGISVGPVHKKDVMKASVMLEKKREYGTILAFDVNVTKEAWELADDLGVKIFIADIIYHLVDQFKAYIDNVKEEKKEEAADEAVFPCVLKILPNCVFNKKDPIVLGVNVLEGIAKIGTPLCIPQREFIEIGRIASIENNHKPVDYAKKGQKVVIKIISSNPDEQQKIFGRHFEMEDELVSKISRNSLNALKENYKDNLSVEEKRLLSKLKKLFKIL